MKHLTPPTDYPCSPELSHQESSPKIFCQISIPFLWHIPPYLVRLPHPTQARQLDKAVITLPAIEKRQHFITDEIKLILIQAALLRIVSKEAIQKRHFVLIITSLSIKRLVWRWLAVKLSMQIPMAPSAKRHAIPELETTCRIDRLAKNMVCFGLPVTSTIQAASSISHTYEPAPKLLAPTLGAARCNCMK
ncbi:hypothetical protein J2T46_003998 [Pseudomonas citronellolis]|nr:hypothetical protein [Pseudomonas citronellolis]MCP1606040.1 hypothetical protein [Pseudomonas citronellolis]MCP1656550.1 hypothetical protein [Pseudomonas citronellolis]MCP1723579.1 hypothetical protein [Pseudomonas citronellolis]